MDRRCEIRELLKMTPQEVIDRASSKLVVCQDIAQLHERCAQDLADEILAAHRAGQPCRLILPVGPTGQYPLLVQKINQQNIPLEGCWFFFMDEYCDESGRTVDAEYPLSFKGEAQRLFFSRLTDGHGLRSDRVIFPDQQNIGKLERRIEEVGGIDTCYGGIGIHGHLAFNEPALGIKDSSPRRVQLNDFTVTINAVRANVGGNLECFPRHAYTLGMRQILGARRIRLYCRNGCDFDWANTVLRLALFGRSGDDYPVTHIRDRDYVIVTDRTTLQSPANLI